MPDFSSEPQTQLSEFLKKPRLFKLFKKCLAFKLSFVVVFTRTHSCVLLSVVHSLISCLYKILNVYLFYA
jgi:hypothetical protein